ncbi:carcinoembryonic antigen-related cell adhesion molecule 1 isoform X2 [Carassius gibelio]|uniref:carcinoembryonic antigen-related cell adhesion molecule 1 isoform X2 n=1 Tax=Carassius gibelio TaxID=101364 RepID=UPI0022788044|nr:carcinoembryonic antigen-related cell adhesion molecule 1 isoform X2 [Carassius gibelio]
MKKRMPFRKYAMILSKCNAVTTCAWILLFLFPAGHGLFNSTSVQTVHRGMSVNISCNYKPSNDTESFIVELQTNNKLCSARKMNTSWKEHLCCNHCRFIWSLETVQMTFEVSNLQINDTGTYKCIVTRSIPPPSVTLREERTFVQVIAQPTVSVTHVRAMSGFPMMLCISEGFYPSGLDQMWIRNGEFLNGSLTHSINKTNPDSSFTVHSYLNTSDCVNYSCWVNHSSLSQPTIHHMSPNECYRNKDENVWIIAVTSAMMILTILILTVVCERSRRAQHKSPVRMNAAPASDLHSQVEYEVYSMLGHHRPVPCSPVSVRSSPNEDILL